MRGRPAGKPIKPARPSTPAKKWTLFLVPHIHLDVGYSDYQPKVAAIQTRTVDEGIDLAEQNPGFCYSVDGSWVLDQFMNTRSAADQLRAIAAMKKGQFFVPAQYAELLTGFPTAETLIRSLYASAQFSRLHGTPFNYANITDVPSYSWSYASILAAAGIHYFVAGPNGHLTRGPILIQGRLNEDSPFWWEGPDGGKVLFWYGRHYWEGGILFGVPPEVRAGQQTIPVFLRTYDHPEYRANAVILFGTQQENTDLFPAAGNVGGCVESRVCISTIALLRLLRRAQRDCAAIWRSYSDNQRRWRSLLGRRHRFKRARCGDGARKREPRTVQRRSWRPCRRS